MASYVQEYGGTARDLNVYQGLSIAGKPIISYNAPVCDSIKTLCNTLKITNGCMGSVQISESRDIPAGWYHYVWIPHRTGGNFGVPNGDNCNYGLLQMFPLGSTNGTWYHAVWSDDSLTGVFSHV